MKADGERVAADGGVRFSYFRVPTSQGEGVACVAVRRLDPRTFEAAFSFCSPLDRHKFNKTRAGDAAVTRLTDDHRDSHCRWSLKFGEPVGGFKTLRTCFEEAMLASTLTYRAHVGIEVLMAPGWFVKAVANKKWEQRKFGMRNPIAPIDMELQE